MPNYFQLFLIVLVSLELVLLFAPLGSWTVRYRRMVRAEPQSVWDHLVEGQGGHWRPGGKAHTVNILSTEPIIRETRISSDETSDDYIVCSEYQHLNAPVSYSCSILQTNADSSRGERLESGTLEAVEGGTLVALTIREPIKGLFQLFGRYNQIQRLFDALQLACEGEAAKRIVKRRRIAHSVFLALASVIGLGLILGTEADDFIFATSILLIVILHEAGHFLAYRIFGHRHVNMMIVPLFGGFVASQNAWNSRFERAMVALAGPGFSALLMPVLVLIAWFVQAETLDADGAASSYGVYATNQFLSYSLDTIIIINYLNLAPFLRLDGGQIIKTFQGAFISRIIVGGMLLLPVMIFAAIIFGWYALGLLAIPFIEAWIEWRKRATAPPDLPSMRGFQKLVVLAAVAMTVLLLFSGTLLIGTFGHDVILNAG